MVGSNFIGKKFALLTGIGIFTFLAANFSVAAASESGCVTCHLDKEMLQKTAKVVKGQKSAMQSGAG
jgi:hypothetical protein